MVPVRRLLMAALVFALSITLAACGALSRNRPRTPPSASESSDTAAHRGRAPDGSGIYVASVPAVLVDDFIGIGLPAVVGWDLTDIPYGIEQIFVVNRWNGAVGQRKEETRLLDRAGKVVVSATAELTGKDRNEFQRADLAQSNIVKLNIANLLPGSYEIAVYLDGREYARYGIRIVAPDQQSSGGGQQQRQ